MITKDKLMINIFQHPMLSEGCDLKTTSTKPHVERVRKAMLKNIEEMSKNPKWIEYLVGINSQSGEGTSKV